MTDRQSAALLLRCPKYGTKVIPSPPEMKQWRTLARLSQRDLGERLGVSAAYIAYLEMGKRVPSPLIISRYWKFARQIERRQNK
jgi:predicted transcriptional regulator